MNASFLHIFLSFFIFFAFLFYATACRLHIFYRSLLTDNGQQKKTNASVKTSSSFLILCYDKSLRRIFNSKPVLRADSGKLLLSNADHFFQHLTALRKTGYANQILLK